MQSFELKTEDDIIETAGLDLAICIMTLLTCNLNNSIMKTQYFDQIDVLELIRATIIVVKYVV